MCDFAGDSDRNGVNQTLIEPFINYNLKDGWYLIMDSIITANWYASSSNQWTVPLGGGAGKLFTIGKQAINSRLEVYYNVVRPDGAPEWNTTFTFQFCFQNKGLILQNTDIYNKGKQVTANLGGDINLWRDV